MVGWANGCAAAQSFSNISNGPREDESEHQVQPYGKNIFGRSLSLGRRRTLEYVDEHTSSNNRWLHGPNATRIPS